ncbi:MAG: hypothetical protein JST54_05485 [Deltaproteobacteria bacterium]|nr:hypothetical protein [Deltaproteobacteria bacterium]
MPRGRTQDSLAVPAGALERIVYELGQRLGAALVRGVETSVMQSGFEPSARPAVRRGPGRPKGSGSATGCMVPACNRRAVAKGLCATHYRKARRLDMGDALSSGELAELARDGRKARLGSSAA